MPCRANDVGFANDVACANDVCLRAHKFNRYNLILTVFGTKSGYLEKIISNPDNEIKYKKETDSQGTDRLHTWSDGINASVSNISIPNPNENVKHNSEEASDTRRSISDADSKVDLATLYEDKIKQHANW